MLSSGRRLDALVGPAGTGKTTAMAAVADAWASGSGQVLGVSTAENATRVLAGQADIPTVNAAKLIYEHTQRPPERRQQRWWQHTCAIAPTAQSPSQTGSSLLSSRAAGRSRDGKLLD